MGRPLRGYETLAVKYTAAGEYVLSCGYIGLSFGNSIDLPRLYFEGQVFINPHRPRHLDCDTFF